jgi:hypothetical protein
MNNLSYIQTNTQIITFLFSQFRVYPYIVNLNQFRMKNKNIVFFLFVISLACQLSSCKNFDRGIEVENMSQKMQNDSLFVNKESEESSYSEMESNCPNQVESSYDEASQNNLEDTTVVDYEDTMISSIENSIKNELECLNLRVSKVKPSKLMAKEFITMVNDNSKDEPICEEGKVFKILSSGVIIGYKIVKENYNGKNKNLYVFDSNGFLYVKHVTEYIEHDIYRYHYNYTGLVMSLEVKNNFTDFHATFNNGVTKEEAFLSYKDKDKIKVASPQGQGKYLTDGQKCSRCTGYYRGGFCDVCGGASGERVNESYSKAANCEFCGGSGLIEKGGIHGGKKLCSSCKGKGKQIY